MLIYEMVKYDPPELEEQISEAIEVWERKTKLEISSVTFEDFEPLQEDHPTIEPDAEFSFSLPGAIEGIGLTYREFLELTHELSTAHIKNDSECWTSQRLLVNVAATQETHEILEWAAVPEAQDQRQEPLRSELQELNREIHRLRRQRDAELDPEHLAEFRSLHESLMAHLRERERILSELTGKRRRFYPTKADYEGQAIVCSLVYEPSPLFSAVLVAEGRYDEYSSPNLSEDLFIEIRFEQPPSEEVAHNVVQAYLFELESSLRLEFAIITYPDLETLDITERVELCIHLPEKIRPLMLGKGVAEPLTLYHQASVTTDLQIKLLYLARVIEHVSTTVVLRNLLHSVRMKLLSPRALDPDAEFIQELSGLIEEQRRFRQDREAVRLTLRTCCDAVELAPLAPPFVRNLAQINHNSNQKDREQAIDNLASVFYATRNAFAHAKANYAPTGDECPEDQLYLLTQCIRAAAQQAIRWYHTQPEALRVT